LQQQTASTRVEISQLRKSIHGDFHKVGTVRPSTDECGGVELNQPPVEEAGEFAEDG
jgi:hypothetical protein